MFYNARDYVTRKVKGLQIRERQATQFKARSSRVTCSKTCDNIRRGTSGQGKGRQGKGRDDKSREGAARQGKTQQCKGRQVKRMGGKAM
jgi:hypothetical protein